MSLLDSLAAALDQEPEQVASGLGLESVGPPRTVRDADVANALMAMPTKVAELEAKVTQSSPVSKEVANALGVPPDADLSKVRAAILKLKVPGAGLSAVRAKLGLPEDAPEVEVCNAIEALQQTRRKTEAEALIDEAVAAGKVPPAHRGFYLREAEADLEAAREVINSLPVMTAPSAAQLNSAKYGLHPADALSEEQQSVCRQLGLTAEEFLAAG